MVRIQHKQMIASIIIWFVMSNFNFKWVQDVLCGGFGVLKKVHYNIIIIGTLRQKKRSKTLIISTSKLNHYYNKLMIYQLKRMYLEWKHLKNAKIQYMLLYRVYTMWGIKQHRELLTLLTLRIFGYLCIHAIHKCCVNVPHHIFHKQSEKNSSMFLKNGSFPL